MYISKKLRVVGSNPARGFLDSSKIKYILEHQNVFILKQFYSLMESTISDIDKKLGIVGGDMLKIEYLESALKNNLPLEVKKYVYIKLSELYVKRLMVGVAARNMESAAEVALNFKEKKELYLKQVELLVKNLSFDEADKAIKKASSFANTRAEKEDLNARYINIFAVRALELEKTQNMKKASEVYERLAYLQPENLDIKKKLAVLYNRLGKIKEAIAMENALKNPQPVQQKPKEFNLDEFLRE